MRRTHEQWSGVPAEVSARDLDELTTQTGLKLPEEYRSRVFSVAGMAWAERVAYFRRCSDGEIRVADRDLGTLLVPADNDFSAVLPESLSSRSSVAYHTAIFDEFVREDVLGDFLIDWRESMLLVFRNSNPQTFCFLDYHFDPHAPPVVFIDTSDLRFSYRRGAVPCWEGIEYVADSFADMLNLTDVANGFEYWESYDAVQGPTSKATAWWDWRDTALAPYEEAAALY